MKFKENAIKPGMVIHCPTEEDARALSEHLIKLGVANANHIMEYYGLNNGVGKTDTVWIKQKEGYLTVEYSDRKWYEKDEYQMEITEFSDLIESDLSNAEIEEKEWEKFCEEEKQSGMSAEEAMDWLWENVQKKDVLYSVFEQDCDMQSIFVKYTPEEIVLKIGQYEAEKKTPKPVEVEYGWCCEIFWVGETGWEPIDDEEVWGVDENAAKDHAAEMARRFITYHVADKQYISGCKEQREAVKNALEDGKTVSYRVFGICRAKEG
ncbi:MAG: hypothetical protein LIP12_00105 [Clostridiales bacterium]|nr:hypothetical protein [Clostridiales bacterium]